MREAMGAPRTMRRETLLAITVEWMVLNWNQGESIETISEERVNEMLVKRYERRVRS